MCSEYMDDKSSWRENDGAEVFVSGFSEQELEDDGTSAGSSSFEPCSSSDIGSDESLSLSESESPSPLPFSAFSGADGMLTAL